MGRSYWFECPKCGYRATVAGRADQGIDFHVQTVVCRECKRLYDAVTQFRVPGVVGLKSGIRRPQLRPTLLRGLDGSRAPSFDAALAHLPYTGMKRFKWLHFKLQCPVSTLHRVQPWNDPDKCPRCGAYLEKNALPYRLWE